MEIHQIGEIMLVKNFKLGRTIAGRLDYNSDLLNSINQICIENKINAGFINIIGALSTFQTGFFKQDEKKYIKLTPLKTDEPLEICSCSGNISLKEGKPFAHLHIVASDRNGQCFGGHLMEGCKVYAAEFHIQEISGDSLIREIDKETMLPLWAD